MLIRRQFIKSTTYGLYRDGTELRGVYYSKPEVAHAACVSMGDRCDYPILLGRLMEYLMLTYMWLIALVGNDPLYGGKQLPHHVMLVVLTGCYARKALVESLRA